MTKIYSNIQAGKNWTKLAKFVLVEENFFQQNILSGEVLSDKVVRRLAMISNLYFCDGLHTFVGFSSCWVTCFMSYDTNCNRLFYYKFSSEIPYNVYETLDSMLD